MKEKYTMNTYSSKHSGFFTASGCGACFACASFGLAVITGVADAMPVCAIYGGIIILLSVSSLIDIIRVINPALPFSSGLK